MSRASTSAPPPAPLQRRPEARTFNVEDLVRRALEGQIRVPEFQRGLKWTPDDVLMLLDSIYRGFPIGTLLLWQRPADAELLRYDTVEVDAPARSDAWMVVDGQQRVRALTQALAGAGHPAEPFAAFFDVKQGRFVRLSRREQPRPEQIPMTEVLDSARLISWLVAEHEPPLSEEVKGAVILLGKRIREYVIPAYLVASEDEDAVRQIYRRANDTGRRMKEHEVFDAIHRPRGGHKPANLREVAASLEAKHGFGGPDEATLLAMLQAIRGVDASKGGVPELGAQAPALLSTLERSGGAAITFLRREALIPHRVLLPYRLPLLVLARFFARFPEPSPRSLELLARWLWRGALTGAHTGATINTRRMLAVIGHDEVEAVQGLLASVPLEGSWIARIEAPFVWKNAGSKILVLALLDLDPQDLRDGAPVRSGQEASWPRLVCKIVDRPGAGLANHVLHPACHQGIARVIARCEAPAWLASHAISEEARRALKFGHEDDFLRIRGLALGEIVREFVARRAGLGELDAPTPEALLERGGG